MNEEIKKQTIRNMVIIMEHLKVEIEEIGQKAKGKSYNLDNIQMDLDELKRQIGGWIGI